MANLSDFLRSINKTKKNVMDADTFAEKEYVPFVVNRSLSYFPDTIFHANQLNRRSSLDKQVQYEYYLYAIPRGNRFARWQKAKKSKDVEVLMEAFGYNRQKANSARDLLTKDQMRLLLSEMDRGGKVIRGKKNS